MVGIEFRNRDRDGIALLDNPHLRDELGAYLDSEEPLLACSHCLGTSGRMFQHRQLKKGELDLAAQRQDRPVMDLLDPSLLVGPRR
jgi:hypothetical protein